MTDEPATDDDDPGERAVVERERAIVDERERAIVDEAVAALRGEGTTAADHPVERRRVQAVIDAIRDAR
jgi:predicted nucleotidyltransferase